MYTHTLYIGSSSQSRAHLLAQAGIPFAQLSHRSDENLVFDQHNFGDYVLAIARDKMMQLNIHAALEQPGMKAFFLTADTLAKTTQSHEILGKPKNWEDARRMVELLYHEPAEVVTGCMLEERLFDGITWKTLSTHEWMASARVSFKIAPDEIDRYFEKMPMALHACGGAIIEGYGHNFLEYVHGSYTAILGLPMYELRCVLKELEF